VSSQQMKKFAARDLHAILLRMQALSRNSSMLRYIGVMPIGRPTAKDRTDFGQQLYERREAARLTQAEVAEQLGISQRAYSAWERDPVAIVPERISTVAGILGTTVAELLGEVAPIRISNTPSGRLGQGVESISKLPRRQQSKILDVVEALLSQQTAGKA
jgi:transcriptional regulator with XRE-family HTH domain